MSITTEKDYRKLDRLSYSSVKKFDENRVKFYKKEILKQYGEEELPSTAMLLGNLVDCKLFSPALFDSKFHIALCNKGNGQMWDFVEELCSLTIKSLDKNLKVTKNISELMEEAFNNVKFDKKGNEISFKKKNFAWLVENFVGSEAEGYYKECRSIFGKDIVDMNLINASEKIIEELKTCEWTKSIINAKTEGDIEILDQLIILFNIEDTPFKAMLDHVIIDHKEKTMTPYDLKITFASEEFQYNYWKMKYYLQVASYYLALRHYATVDRPELSDYIIPSIEFIVGSSNLNSNPLLYSTSPVNVGEGLMGFELNGKKYKGLFELVREIEWHKKNQLWRNSKEVYENKGRMAIKPFVNEI